MFQDLDEALRRILDDAAAPADLRNADVSFETPDKTFAPLQPTVNLFLYEVKENRELRDPVPIVTKIGDSFTRRTPPLRADCSYMVTTWSRLTGAAKVAEEHRLLALALAWLSRFPTIPPVYLLGTLLGQPFPPPTMVAQMDNGKSTGEFWSALGSPPRPSFNVIATIAMDLGLLIEGPLVTTHFSDFSAETWVQIGGYVRAAGGQAVANALVDILDAGLRTRSDQDGRYSFPRVPEGAHTLRVVATGFQPRTQPLVVPALPEEYDVTLTPL